MSLLRLSLPSLFLWLRGWHAPAGRRSVNPGLLPRPGRSDRQRRWVPKATRTRPAGRYQDNPHTASGRTTGQTGSQPDPTPVPTQNHGSRAEALIHILPAEYGWSTTISVAPTAR